MDRFRWDDRGQIACRGDIACRGEIACRGDIARLKGSRSVGGGECEGFVRAIVWPEREAFSRAIVYNFKYSRSRRVCMRLTGISVDFSSFIRRM